MSTLGAQHWTQQFLNSSGTPYAAAKLYHYVAGTTTDTDIWSDEGKTSAAAQPLIADAAGRFSFYGDNTYRIKIHDSNDSPISGLDFDNVKIMHKDVTLRNENRALSYPSATTSNRGHMFGKVASGGNLSEVGINLDGTQFSPIQFQGGTITARQQTWAYGADLASATTLTLGSDGNVFDVTGNTTITGLSSTTEGTPIVLRMQGQAILQHNSTSLILWNGLNWTPETGDVIFFESLGSGNYYEVSRRSNSIISDPQELQNVALSAAVATNALTISLKTRDGDDPSGTDQCRISFRNATLTTGTYTTRTVSSAKSVVVSNGSTLGALNSQYLRLWVVALDAESASAGAGVELGVYRALSNSDSSIVSIFEGAVYSSTAEGGAGGADSAQVLYSTTTRANVPVRVLGYVDVQAGTAGAWTNSPTTVQIMGPGVPRAGETIKTYRASTGAVSTGTTVVNVDDSLPQQSAEGFSVLSVAVTPQAASHVLRTRAKVNYATSASARIATILFQDADNDALRVSAEFVNDTGTLRFGTVEDVRNAGTTSSTTLKTYVGPSTAATVTINGQAGGRIFAGRMDSFMQVEEVSA